VTRFIPISQPSIGEKEIAYVTDAVSSGWVSSIGKYIEKFEETFAEYCNVKFALATSNGTTGLHLALLGHGISAGDEVILPDLTFVATANAVTYVGATPVMVDVDKDTLCICPDAIRKAITPKTRAIIPVHLYGHSADMIKINEIAKEFNLVVIEDAAEAHGAVLNGQKVGSFGNCGVFSFYGNKIITSGEGGMITTNDEVLYLNVKRLRDHAMNPNKRYWHDEIGYNYRMTNLQAALGVAQLERIDTFIEKRREVMAWYKELLGTYSQLKLNYESPEAESVYWMICLEVQGLTEETRDHFMITLRARNVDSRPYFYPLSDMPMFLQASTPMTHKIYPTGINLPSFYDITHEDVIYVCKQVKATLMEMNLL
jgi:perosamine synthetase